MTSNSGNIGLSPPDTVVPSSDQSSIAPTTATAGAEATTTATTNSSLKSIHSNTSSISSSERLNFQALLHENEKLRRQLQHVESLGRLVADCKQSNLHLSKENSDLHERLALLERMQYKNTTWNGRSRDQNSDDDYSSEDDEPEKEQMDEPFEVVKSDEHSSVELVTSNDDSVTCPMTLSLSHAQRTDSVKGTENVSDASGKLSSLSVSNEERSPHSHTTVKEKNSENTEHNNLESPSTGSAEAGKSEMSYPNLSIEEEESRSKSTVMEAAAAAAYCERQAHNSMTSISEEINVFNEVLRSENPVSQLEMRQLRDIVEATHVDSTAEADEQFMASLEEDTTSSGSVTAQFAKLATVFARLAQRVMHTQKRARNSQAFCESLMRENSKLNKSLSAEKKKVADLQAQVEEKEAEIKRLSSKDIPSTSRKERPRHSRSLTDETLVKESAHASPNDVLPSMTDPAKETDVAKLQAQIKKLYSQRHEILTVNKQWHTQYHKLKDECSAKLAASKAEIEELKEQVTGKQRENAKRRKDIDTLLREAKKEIDLLQRQKADLAKSYAMEHSKIQSLNEKIQKLKSDLSCIEAENQRLNQALEAAYSIRQNRQLSITNSLYEDHLSDTIATGHPGQPELHPGEEVPDAVQEQPQVAETTPGEVEDLKTQIEVLQEQVKIYREDFETERRDREKSQAEKQRLAEEMARMRDEMRALTQQVRAHEQDFRQERREKQRLQRQLSRIQMQVTTGNERGADFYYDVDVPDAFGANFQRPVRRHHSPTRDRDHHRYRPHEAVQERGELADILIQTATVPTVDASRRYTTRSRTHPPPPYTQDTNRHRRRPTTVTTARRIHDGYLEPERYDHEPEVVYPPGNHLNQF